jgi:hypothetical protein
MIFVQVLLTSEESEVRRGAEGDYLLIAYCISGGAEQDCAVPDARGRLDGACTIGLAWMNLSVNGDPLNIPDDRVEGGTTGDVTVAR